MYEERIPLYQSLEREQNSKVLVYVTGDRQGMETQIHSEVLDLFLDHLDTFGKTEKISLYLYSRGGHTLAGWTIVNLIRQFCNTFEVIVPSKAQSTATLICLGADTIVMTKQATLGPIDPSTNSPLNPQVPGAPEHARLPVSVEDVAAFLELAKSEAKITKEENLTSIFLKLSEKVHPVALGNVYRARTQIQMLARKLLNFHMTEEDKMAKIISVLCSESGSHDYTINRAEAQAELFLPIVKPNDELYSIVNGIYNSIRKELQFDSRFNMEVMLENESQKDYNLIRGLIESVTGGSHRFTSRGTLTRATVQTQSGPVQAVNDHRKFEGWEYENPR